MESKKIICIVCPIGCYLEIINENGTNYKVKNAKCEKGIDYGIKEITNPTRILTSTVKIKGSTNPMMPVRTDKEIPKNKIFECMGEINKVELKAPVEIGQIIIKNILDLNVNIIASKTMSKKEKINDD